MNCSDYQAQILDDSSCVDRDAALHAHVQSCPNCYNAWKESVLTEKLQVMAQVPAMSEGFAERLQQKVAEKAQQQAAEKAKPKKTARANQPWFAYSGIAAAFLMVGLFLQPMLATDKVNAPFSNQMTKVSVLPNQFETVNVMLNSAQQYDQAELSISVSGAVRFDPNDSIQTVSWQTGLKQGKNILPIPVYLLNEQGGKLTIKMKTATGFKQVEIDVDAMKAPAKQETFL